MKFSLKKVPIYILLILIVAFFMRLGQVLFLRTQVYGVAETEIIYIQASLKIIFNNMNPGLFFHASLYFYLISFIYSCLLVIGKVLGLFITNVDFMMLFLEKPTVFYFISRMVSVFASTATVYFIYQLGTYLWNKKTGLLAAFLFTIAPMSLAQGTEASVYAVTNLLIVLSALRWLRFIKEPERYGIMGASFVFGLALAADYYALFLIPFFVISYGYAQKSRNTKLSSDIFIFCATVFLVFMLANPYFIFRPRLVWQSIAMQAHVAIFSEYNQHHSLFRYLGLLLSPAYIINSMFFFIGAYFSIKRQRPWTIAILSFPLANIIFFSFSKIQLEHYIFHSLPFMALVSASAMMVLMRLRKLSFTVLILIMICFTFFGIQSYKHKFYNKDTWAAKSWIEENIPKKTAVLIQAGTIPFAQPILFQILYNSRSNSNERFYFAVLDRYLEKYPQEDYRFWTCNFIKGSIPLINYRNIQYIVLSEKNYDQAGIDWLAKNAVLIKTFSKYGDTWRIRIYKVLYPSLEKADTERSWW